MPRPSEEQWRAARLAADGAPMTRARIAGMLGVDVGAVYLRAAQEGWRTMDFRRPDVREAYQQAVEIAAALGASDAQQEDDWLPRWPGDTRQADKGSGEAENAAAGGAEGGTGAAGPASNKDKEAADPLEMLARASNFVARQLDRIIAAADRRGGRLDKGQIDGLAALARVAERWEAVAAEQARERQRADDDERAGTLREVVDCLVRHSEAEAKRLVEEFLAAQPDGGAGWRVAVGGEA